jgi:hypothetical protein
MITRRNILRAAPAMALVIAGCATHPSGPQIANIAATVKVAANAIVAQLAVAGLHVPDNIMVQLSAAANDVEANANAIATALDKGPIADKIHELIVLMGNLVAPYYPQAPKVAQAVASALDLAAQLVADVKAGVA